MLRSSFRLVRFPKITPTEEKKEAKGEAEAEAKETGEAEEDAKTGVALIIRGTSNIMSPLRKSSRRTLKPLGLNSQAKGQHSPSN